jgi:hypothetical protein
MQRKLIAGVIVLALAGASRADEPIAKQLYGSGVHAYFAGQHKQAHEFLTSAIESKSEDPRVFYFRGLSLWQMGRPEQAQKDFATAAMMEATAADDVYSVDRALERVQGKARLAIEQARVTARKVATQKRQREEELRFNQIRENEPRILELPKSPAKSPGKTVEPKPADEPKEDPDGDPKDAPAKGGKEPVKDGGAAFDPFKEASLPKPAIKKASAEEPADEPRVAEGAKKDAPPGKSGARALLKALGKVAENYARDVSELPKSIASGGGAPALAPPKVPEPKEKQ